MKRESADDHIVVGRIGAAHGVKGWLRIASFTETPADIFAYMPWIISAREKTAADSTPIVTEPQHWRLQGNGYLVKLAEIDDRTHAEALKGAEVSVSAQVLPSLDQGQYYWRDLIGLGVRLGDQRIGYVERIFDTGANDVLVVRQDTVTDATEVVEVVDTDTDTGRRDTAAEGKDRDKEWLIPCTGETLLAVDLVAGELTLDWVLDADS